jgi:hypothetical protein
MQAFVLLIRFAVPKWFNEYFVQKDFEISGDVWTCSEVHQKVLQ